MGANSVKGLVLMETVYPSADGRTVFDNPEMATKLAKEMKKGTIKTPTVKDEADVDEDLDTKLEENVAEIWSYYDKKNLGSIPKKEAIKFFKDALELFALRRGVKSKEVLGAGVKEGKALEECYNVMSGSAPTVTKQQFEAYIHCNDLEEALSHLTGATGGKDIPAHLPSNMMFDPNTLPKEATGVDMKNIEYRDYNLSLDD
eukprot:TRINITY_DN236_c0_g1_i3.p1 TRINITY_DN236_c0_g1~~TRINITY_DN236_c0_g1_i3.p1  ORF type:complete len:202 (+),score=69.10 TRINITY_DN236_c0_g1_i3:98-703(+)